MAITVGSVADSTSASSATLTFSLNNVAGDYLIVAYEEYGSTVDHYSSVTYAGVAMTPLGFRAATTSCVKLMGLIAPATGTNNVVITLTGVAVIIIGIAQSYLGTNQTTQPDQAVTMTAGATTLTNTQNTTTDQSWLVMGHESNTGNATAGAGTTLRKQDSTYGALALFDSNGGLSIGSQSLVAVSGSTDACNVMAGLRPAGGGSSPSLSPPRLMLLGVM